MIWYNRVCLGTPVEISFQINFFEDLLMVDRNAEAIAEQLLTWSTPERARLASLLLASLEKGETEVDAAWDVEVERRSAELDADPTISIAAVDVFAELERRMR